MAKEKTQVNGTLDKSDRRELAKQLITTGHLFAGGLLIKQIFSGQPFNFLLASLGLFIDGLELCPSCESYERECQ